MQNVSDRPVQCDRVSVALGPRSYDILVGPRLLETAGQALRGLLARPRVVVVTDRAVADRHLATLDQAFDAAAIAHQSIVLPPGEGTKDFAHLEELTGYLLDAEVERGDVLVAFGGGVIGDLAGFAASIVRRGMDFVQIPTTLLAQVDSSVGGKTGINSVHGKNLIGAFHQPRLVIADTAVLDTLPMREIKAGYAEVVKYGLLGDAAFFAWLEKNGADVLSGRADARRYAITRSCAAKAAIVGHDEHETNDHRALLNLGHTFAHAFEAEAAYSSRLLHGEAVAIGLSLAFALSVELGLCPPADLERVRRHLGAVGLPTSPAEAGLTGISSERIAARMRQDKKVKDGALTFILARGIGHAFVERAVPAAALARVLENALGA